MPKKSLCYKFFQCFSGFFLFHFRLFLQNLIKLVSLGFTEGYYYKPRIDLEILQQYKDGLICLELFTSHVFIEKKKETRFGRLISGTSYGDYAIENKTLEDNSEFLKPRGAYKYNYVCTFKYNDFKIGVWYNLELNEYFCDEIVDLSCIHKFTMSLDDFAITFFTRGTVGLDTLSTYIYTDARKGGLTPELRPLITIMFLGVLVLLIVVNIRKMRNAKNAAVK